ncbi:MAG: hypothetical protein DRJ52_00695 [Thermoprotei archaeon]|nr:MAG: hypothetical protein DRJ52_00695 [Thermoprotei archaeon]RLF00411.1 MAG: hypothetical protein DRJ63_02410 [Thermoprotei archaeon]
MSYEFFEAIRRLKKEVDEFMDYLERRFTEEIMGDHAVECIEPLAEIREYPDKYVVIIDLPCVRRREDINVKLTEDTIIIEAQMYRKVEIYDLMSNVKRTEFSSYRKSIRLPQPIDPKKATATFKKGMLILMLPKKSYGHEIRVE